MMMMMIIIRVLDNNMIYYEVGHTPILPHADLGRVPEFSWAGNAIGGGVADRHVVRGFDGWGRIFPLARWPKCAGGGRQEEPSTGVGCTRFPERGQQRGGERQKRLSTYDETPGKRGKSARRHLWRYGLLQIFTRLVKLPLLTLSHQAGVQ